MRNHVSHRSEADTRQWIGPGIGVFLLIVSLVFLKTAAYNTIFFQPVTKKFFFTYPTMAMFTNFLSRPIQDILHDSGILFLRVLLSMAIGVLCFKISKERKKDLGNSLFVCTALVVVVYECILFLVSNNYTLSINDMIILSIGCCVGFGVFTKLKRPRSA